MPTKHRQGWIKLAAASVPTTAATAAVLLVSSGCTLMDNLEVHNDSSGSIRIYQSLEIIKPGKRKEIGVVLPHRNKTFLYVLTPTGNEYKIVVARDGITSGKGADLVFIAGTNGLQKHTVVVTVPK